MPITRKILKVGNSKAITIPATWLSNAEEQEGRKITAMALEVDRVITIQPVFEKKELQIFKGVKICQE
jgi:antitoxin component of MazEF toxin-antitoxin module